MAASLTKILCIRYCSFKQKVRLVKKYSRRGYNVEILNNNFVYAESKEYEMEKLEDKNE